MSSKYNTVKSYYDKKLWNAAKVRLAVDKGWITKEEFKEITGQDY